MTRKIIIVAALSQQVRTSIRSNELFEEKIVLTELRGNGLQEEIHESVTTI